MSSEKAALKLDIAAAIAVVFRRESFRRTLDYWQDADEDTDRLGLLTEPLAQAVMDELEKPH